MKVEQKKKMRSKRTQLVSYTESIFLLLTFHSLKCNACVCLVMKKRCSCWQTETRVLTIDSKHTCFPPVHQPSLSCAHHKKTYYLEVKILRRSWDGNFLFAVKTRRLGVRKRLAPRKELERPSSSLQRIDRVLRGKQTFDALPSHHPSHSSPSFFLPLVSQYSHSVLVW